MLLSNSRFDYQGRTTAIGFDSPGGDLKVVTFTSRQPCPESRESEEESCKSLKGARNLTIQLQFPDKSKNLYDHSSKWFYSCIYQPSTKMNEAMPNMFGDGHRISFSTLLT